MWNEYICRYILYIICIPSTIYILYIWYHTLNIYIKCTISKLGWDISGGPSEQWYLVVFEVNLEGWMIWPDRPGWKSFQPVKKLQRHEKEHSVFNKPKVALLNWNAAYVWIWEWKRYLRLDGLKAEPEIRTWVWVVYWGRDTRKQKWGKGESGVEKGEEPLKCDPWATYSCGFNLAGDHLRNCVECSTRG